MKSISDHIVFSTYPGKRITCCAIVFCSFLCLYPRISSGAGTDTPAPVAGPTDSRQDIFEYVIQNRKDPFLPFITERAATSDVNMDEIVDTQAELTGMQLFEPGQLNLVALIKRGDDDFAMVEDFTGKGYVISKGTKIGKRGVVKEIVPNMVIIEETAQTRAGQKIVTNTEMVLKKEGEE